jgi:hypothetical protein
VTIRGTLRSELAADRLSGHQDAEALLAKPFGPLDREPLELVGLGPLLAAVSTVGPGAEVATVAEAIPQLMLKVLRVAKGALPGSSSEVVECKAILLDPVSKIAAL